MDDDIVVVSEKRQIEKFKYKIWPGDEKDENQQVASYYISNKPSNVFKPKTLEEYRYLNGFDKNGKRKRDEDKSKTSKDDDNDDESRSKRPNMTNRYFSSENLKLITEEKKSEKNKPLTTESDEFIKRRDFLLNRLFQNRSLPEPEKENGQLIEPIQLKKIEKDKFQKPARKHDFQEEFIPLFKSDSDKREVEIKETTSEEKNYYDGPYPHKCIKRVKNALIEAFEPVKNAGYTSRSAEIAKMKVQIPSKFDKDSRLWNRIKRETLKIRQNLLDKIAMYKRHEAKMVTKKSKKIELIQLDDDSDDSDNNKNEVIKMINSVNKKKKNIKFDDESDEIMISDENGTSDQSDLDSKCVQFGNYSKTSINDKNSKKPKKNSREFESGSPDSTRNSTRLKINKKKKNNNNNMNADELELLKLEYRNLRNLKNKSMKSIKKNVKDGASRQMSLEIERELMNEKMTKLRRKIKKLNRKKRPNNNNNDINNSKSFKTSEIVVFNNKQLKKFNVNKNEDLDNYTDNKKSRKKKKFNAKKSFKKRPSKIKT